MDIGIRKREDALEGLLDGRWAVRRAAIGWLNRHARPEDLEAVVPLLRDPKAEVRGFALLTLGRERDHVLPFAVVPLVMERVRVDESLRLRRRAVMLLAFAHAHPHLESFFQELLDTETDAKLHRFAGIGLFLSRQKREAIAC